MTKSWAVTVERDGESILTLGSNHLAGRDFIDGDEDTIRTVARHLLAFIGDPDLQSQLTAISTERDEWKRHATDIWDALADDVARNGERDVPDGSTVAEAVKKLLVDLHDAEEQVRVLRPGGTYAWKLRAYKAEADLSTVREALKAAAQFLDPGVDRGPAVDGWDNTRMLVEAALQPSKEEK
jgi:hypothetical protein